MFGFSDETYIDVSSGNGGAGCVSFHREKFVPKGGPDGGDGGKGGDVVFVVKDNLRTLGHLKATRTYKAENGQGGQGDRCFGRNGRDVEIPVPPGTVLRDAESGEIIKDLTGLDRYVFLKGGRGGLGNWHFRTAVRQAPKFAQPGEKGVSMRIGVELQIIADIGFVGFPNAGKSSLLNMLTNARSKVAGYPFTTKIPQLGVMRYDDRDIVLADIPGILDGTLHGILRDLVEGDTAALLPFQLQRVVQMPGDRLPFPVGVRRQIYFIRLLYLLAQLRQDLALSPDCNIFWFIIIIKINSHGAFGKITHMPVRSNDLIALSQKLLDGLRLRRRLHNHQLGCHFQYTPNLIYIDIWHSTLSDSYLRDKLPCVPLTKKDLSGRYIFVIKSLVP